MYRYPHPLTPFVRYRSKWSRLPRVRRWICRIRGHRPSDMVASWWQRRAGGEWEALEQKVAGGCCDRCGAVLVGVDIPTAGIDYIDGISGTGVQ